MIRDQDQFDEHFRMLGADLEALVKLVFTHGKPVLEADIRLASVILRKWLIEGLLGKLCNSARVKPTFPVLDNAEICATLPKIPEVNYFLTAGIRMNGLAVQAIYNATVPPTNEPLLPVNTLCMREFGSSEFIKQKRLYFEGTFFTCEEIIKFTANKLGGAHLDFERSGSLEQLNRAATFMMYGGPANPGLVVSPIEVYMVLEPGSAEILSGLHLEIIAAAASLVQVRLDGKPVIKVKISTSLTNRIRRWLRPTRSGSRIIGYGADEKQ